MTLLAVLVLSLGCLPATAADFSRGGGGNFQYRGGGGSGFSGIPRFPRDSRFFGGTSPSGSGRFWANRRISDGRPGNRNFGRDSRSYAGRDGWSRDGRHDWRRNNDFRRNGFAGNGIGNGFGGRRPLPRLSSPSDFVTNHRSGVNVVISNQPDTSIIGNYAGATSVYRSNGGTYVVSSGSYGGGMERTSTTSRRPRATIIDVEAAVNPCSRESGVCVIRP